MTSYLFYPGCSMETSAKAYYESMVAVNKTLGLDLIEIGDWNCCGATEYLGISLIPAYALISRNLALASQQSNGSKTVVASCSACYLNLVKADHYMLERPELGDKVSLALQAGNLFYKPGSLEIRHFLDILINDIGLDVIKSKVEKPLKGIRVAPYLGCMVPRPDYNKRWSDHEHPDELDRLLLALGAEVIDFPLKTHCCSGHMPQISPSTAFELIRRLLHGADQYKADMIITVCPMCQMNLDAFQAETNRFFHTNYKIPILFFTQLMGLAFGRDPKELGFGRELVSARTALKRIGLEAPEPEPSKMQAKRTKKTGLPMPNMPADEEAKQ